MATLTDAQRIAIQKKIDAAVRAKAKSGGFNEESANVLRIVAEELQRQLLIHAPSVVNAETTRYKPKVSASGKAAVINAVMELGFNSGNMRESFSQFGPNLSHQPEYVDLIQIFNNGTNIENTPPFGEWHNRWIQGSTDPTWRFRDKEGFIQDALMATKPLADSYGVRIKYSNAYDEDAKPKYGYGGIDNTFGMRYAW